nr:MAG TPA: hypothetical protein [Caudoviricetes sp.]
METVLEIIKRNSTVENAVMYIAKSVRKCGKVNDVISFSGKNIYIRTSDDESTLSYMHELKDFFEFRLGGTISTDKEHGLHLELLYYDVVLPTMIMKVHRLSDGVMFKNVEFDVSAIGSDLKFVRDIFGASFTEEVLK